MFCPSLLELPVVPLSITSRGMVHLENSGFSDMEVSYRLPQHCPVDLAVTFPEGRQVPQFVGTAVKHHARDFFVSSLAEAVKRDGGVYLAPWVAFGLFKLQY